MFGCYSDTLAECESVDIEPLYTIALPYPPSTSWGNYKGTIRAQNSSIGLSAELNLPPHVPRSLLCLRIETATDTISFPPSSAQLPFLEH